jgi:uncharacterized protein involved in exopolysaccharide biosynthesis
MKKSQSSTKETKGVEINLLDYLLVLSKNFRITIKIILVTFVLSCILTLLMPDIYTATARIIPPNNDRSSLTGVLAGIDGVASLFNGAAIGPTPDLYVGMLKSRTIADAIIDRFELMQIYNCTARHNTYKALNENVKVELIKKSGIISISVNDKDPIRAAAIANAYIEELRRLKVKLNLTSSGQERSFLANRLDVVRQELDRTEQQLRDFQVRNKAIHLDEQANNLIEAAAKLKAELANKEVQLGMLLTYQTGRNPEVRAVREGITRINEQIRRLEPSQESKDNSGAHFFTTTNVPDLAVQYARLLREFKTQEALYELLTQQYELAKVSEAKSDVTIDVLDEAVAPDRKSKPQRGVIVLGATFGAAVFTMIGVFVREFWSGLSADDCERWAAIKKNIRFGR